MPRQPDILRPTSLDLALPEDIRARLDLLLISPSEGKVPKGAYKRFFMELIKTHFDGEGLDLSEISGATPPGRYSVRGDKESIKQLRLITGK